MVEFGRVTLGTAAPKVTHTRFAHGHVARAVGCALGQNAFAVSTAYHAPMPERSPSPPPDPDQPKTPSVDDSTADAPEEPPAREKNAAAVELGRLGGLKGGKARAKKLTPEQRSESARKAAHARWHPKES